MACINKAHIHSGKQGEFFLIPVRYKQFQCSQCLIHCVQRHIGIAAVSHGFPVSPFCFKFLNVRAVAQHDFTERGCRFCCVNFSGKSAGKQQRKQPGVVNVGMCEKNVVNLTGGAWDFYIFIGVSPLLHPEIHQNAFSADFQISTASGYFMCSTNKYHFHKLRSFLCIL